MKKKKKHIYLNHFAVQKKLMQHCKLTILQKKKVYVYKEKQLNTKRVIIKRESLFLGGRLKETYLPFRSQRTQRATA